MWDHFKSLKILNTHSCPFLGEKKGILSWPVISKKQAKTEKHKKNDHKYIALAWLSLTVYLALLTKVLRELFQLLKVLIVYSWLRVGQRSQHVRLKTDEQTLHTVCQCSIQCCSSLTMQTTGSKSFSPGTSIHVISIALGSPGEQGVKRSFISTFGSCPSMALLPTEKTLKF
ncbi:hypothetical protein NQD34_012572 [Periophthalmus magnuspinnatus]|nr:hypothetical protein NQD34_012572 [Periophthalmus magnuspinnatus]